MEELIEQIKTTIKDAFSNQNDVAVLYAEAVKKDLCGDNAVNWPEIEEMIVKRWSVNQLNIIRRTAWGAITEHPTFGPVKPLQAETKKKSTRKKAAKKDEGS